MSVSVGEIAYLCHAANRYFRARVDPSDLVRAVAGANAVVDRQDKGLARDGEMTFDAGRGKAPLLRYGGDVTTSRRRAEFAVNKLVPFYPMSRRWTAKAALPGGDFASARFDDEVDRAQSRWRFLSESQARRLVAAYGTRIGVVLGDAQSRDDLGARASAMI